MGIKKGAGQEVNPENQVDDIESADSSEPIYEQIEVPLDAAFVDQQIKNALAEERSNNRNAIADAVEQALKSHIAGQQVVSGQSQYDVFPVAPNGVDIDVQAADVDDVQMDNLDGGVLPLSAQRGNGGREAEQIYGAGPGPRYGRVTESEMLVSVAALREAREALEQKAADMEQNQKHAAAQAARARRTNRILSVIGLAGGVLSGIGILVSTLLHSHDKVKHIAATDAEGGKGNDPTKPVTVDITKHVVVLDAGGSIDKGSIKLYPSDDGEVTKKTIKKLGVWEAKANGTVTFTPDSKFPGGPVSILYTIADTKGNRTPSAAVQIDYTTKRISGDGGPITTDVEKDNLIIGGTEKIAILDSTKPASGGAAVADDSVELLAPDLQNPSSIVPFKSYFAQAQGTWNVAVTGEVTFRPIQGFHGGTALIRYRVKDTAGKTSDSAEIRLNYKLRPVVPSILIDEPKFMAGIAYSANVLNGGTQKGTGDVPAAKAADGLKIDPKSVILTNIVKHESEVRAPDATASNGMKKLVVVGEGTWDSSDPTGKITFTPEADLSEDPHPVIFQVADNKSVLSNAAMLIMSSKARKVQASLRNLNAMDDDAFWKNYEHEVVKANLGDDLISALLVVRSITTSLWLNTRSAIIDDGSNRDTWDQIKQVRDNGGLVTPNSSFLLWRSGKPSDPEPPLSSEKLFTLSKKIDVTEVNNAVKALNAAAVKKGNTPPITIDATTPLATRYLRLYYLETVLAAFNRVIFNVNAKQARVPPAGNQN